MYNLVKYSRIMLCLCNSEKQSGSLCVVSPAERLRGLQLGTGAAADVGLRQVRFLLRLRFCQGSLLRLGRETVCGNMVTCTEVREHAHTRIQSRLCFVVDPESVFASTSSAVHFSASLCPPGVSLGTRGACLNPVWAARRCDCSLL